MVRNEPVSTRWQQALYGPPHDELATTRRHVLLSRPARQQQLNRVLPRFSRLSGQEWTCLHYDTKLGLIGWTPKEAKTQTNIQKKTVRILQKQHKGETKQVLRWRRWKTHPASPQDQTSRTLVIYKMDLLRNRNSRRTPLNLCIYLVGRTEPIPPHGYTTSLQNFSDLTPASLKTPALRHLTCHHCNNHTITTWLGWWRQPTMHYQLSKHPSFQGTTQQTKLKRSDSFPLVVTTNAILDLASDNHLSHRLFQRLLCRCGIGNPVPNFRYSTPVQPLSARTKFKEPMRTTAVFTSTLQA